MGRIDPEQERQRLLGLYSAMSDDELRELAHDTESLTEPARLALKQELGHRSIPLPAEEQSVADAESTVAEEYGPCDAEIRSGDFVTIRHIDFPGEAIALQAFLKSAGITSVLVDDLGQSFRSQIRGHGWGRNLQVSRQDAERAVELLDTAFTDTPEPESDRE